MRVRYLLAGLLAGAVIATAAQGDARGEFRQVPKWWVSQAMCVHRGEGSWRANTGNGYYGGLQMDLSFQRRHGGWMLRHYGTADHWSPRAQLIIGYRAWRVRGWWPWPNTARRCGLL